MLVQFIAANREEILARTRAEVAKRSAPIATEGELADLPHFLDRIVESVRQSAPLPGVVASSAAAHGADLLGRGHTVAQVVHDYCDICRAISELAYETNASITSEDFLALNTWLDNAIAEAVTEYSRLRDKSAAAGETERLGAFAHELRNRLTSAQLAFQAIKSGRAPVGGSIASVVTQSLQAMTALISRTLLDVRVDSGNVRLQRTNLRGLLEEVEVGGTVEAGARGVSLRVDPIDPGIDVDTDPQILAGAVVNLLQNAFKFTHPGGCVSIRTSVVGGCALIEIEDECGGLPPGKLQELFDAFTQRGADRTGLGLGLFISRKGLAACGGDIRVRDLAGRGCVFTIALPVSGARVAAS